MAVQSIKKVSAPVDRIELLDVVALHEAKGDVLPAGRTGTVVEVFADGTLLVEFADGLGVMQDLLELSPSEVRLVWSANGAD